MVVYFKKWQRGKQSLPDTQGAVLAVHNPTKTAILHINLCICTGIMLKYSLNSHIKTVWC